MMMFLLGVLATYGFSFLVLALILALARPGLSSGARKFNARSLQFTGPYRLQVGAKLHPIEAGHRR